jgi:hypothetical protein
LLAMSERGQVDAEFLARFGAEIAMKLPGHDKQNTARLFNNSPRNSGESFSHAWFPGKNEAVDQGGAGEIFDLEFFETEFWHWLTVKKMVWLI